MVNNSYPPELDDVIPQWDSFLFGPIPGTPDAGHLSEDYPRYEEDEADDVPDFDPEDTSTWDQQDIAEAQLKASHYSAWCDI